MKNYLKRTTTFILALLMLLSVPLQAFAEGNYDTSKIINNKVPVKPVKTDNAADLIKNPDQPAIYTLRTDYKVQRGERYDINYQPYIASVGEAATQAEKDKVKQTVKLPDLTGYEKPDDDYKIDYDTVKNAANGNNKTGNDTNGIRYQANKDFKYKAKSNTITIKHVFQDLEDFTKYTNPNGSVGEEGQLITTQNGNTGSTMEVIPLGENDPNRKGFIPEAPFITMQVPENAENFILEYRYNRAHYDVNFDTAGGTAIPSRTLYYGQKIPGIDKVPTKEGSNFQGWKPSVELKNYKGRTFKADKIIKDKEEYGNAVNELNNDLIMPAENVTFTAVWQDKAKADYAVQFWAEKADHADGATLADKYDYIGTRVYKDQATGSRPDLDNEPVKDIVFTDLDQARLNKIWANARFNRGKDLYLNKFYVYNQDLTHDQNKDPANVNLVKSVDSTGKTVYNIYYDRQVYDLYFTKSNAQPAENTFYPEIWGYDEDQGEVVKKGGPGNPYHYKARFNQLMLGWPNDAMQTKGFKPGYQSFGWGPNYTKPNWPVHLDTPPYRLNADEFLDMANYIPWGGYAKPIDKGDGTTIPVDKHDFTTLSFGIKQSENSMPHHMDFWMDGFKDGETIIRYDLYRFKADTDSESYVPRYPKVQGFTGKRAFEPAEFLDEGDIDAKNDERAEVTPFPTKTYTVFGDELPVGKMKFISNFFCNIDEFGDPLTDEDGEPLVKPFEKNGYLKFEYSRNKYPLRFNYDPSKIKGDSEFNSTNQLQTFYEFPLKALSPDLAGNEEYKKENPANLLDNPEKLQELKLTDLVFTDPKDGKLKVKRPDNLSDQMVFKGWALDPAGTKLIWENAGEKMPNHPVNLYAKWGEPDYKWKVTFDPNGGSLRNIKEENLTTSRKKIQEGDIGQEEINTYAKKEANEGDKQIFTVIQRQKLVEPKYKPTRKGYDFMGWEVIRYKKDANTGDYTNEQDTSYRDTYKVPELYSFGNDVVAPVYLKAIWVPNQRVDVKVEHYMLDKDYKLVKKLEDTLEDKRANYLVATTGDKQDDEYILAPHEELEKKLTGDLKTTYEEYNERVKGDNTFFQQFRVEPAQILNTETNKIEDNPKVTDNIFKFFYIPFRQREYKVNYIDERFKGKTNEAEGAIVPQELVSNGNRHYDARNYRPIPGWVLAEGEKPQQQLFFDVNEKTNEFLGINGTGKDEITFYYKDVRVIEVSKDGKTPDGYVRVTFKADKGGSFGKDAQGKDITELNYDVIKGLKSDLLPVPKELKDGEEKVADKYYITPETGKKFIKWDEKPLLNKNTIINENHTFAAYFEWSGLTASGLVRTEAFKDPNGTWTNDFAPTIDQLKKQLVWREKDQVKDLPAGTVIKLYDEKGNELTTDDQVFALVNEKKADDKDELVRTVNVKAKVTFKDGKDPQELVIPITVYKNVYEALNEKGDKPLFLTEAEKKDAKDGGLKDVTGNYVKVTVQPTEKNTNKDAKVYYVNPKAWVNIPEVEWSEADKDKTDFLKWTADKKDQNENKEENGIFDFSKRHKFTDEETLIKPLFTNDVVEQKEDEDKPKVPDNFVKVIVKTTDKATSELTQTFWVNPTKEVTIPVTDPTGKENQEVEITGLGKKNVNYIFKEWQKVQTGESDDNLTEVKPAVKIDLAKNKYTDKVTVIEASYFERFEATPIVKPIKTEELHTPEGKEITDEILKGKIIPPENKEIESITVVERPNPSNPGKQEAKVTIKYKDGSTQGTNDNPVIIPVEVHKNIIPEVIPGQEPEGAMDNYVKVTFKAGTGGTLSGYLVYYVSPEVEVDMTESAGKIKKTPEVGYISGDWDTSETKKLKATFTAKETEFTFNFKKTGDIVEKTDDNVKKPDGFVTVRFLTNKNGTLTGVTTYYVNPKAGKKMTDITAPTITANDGYKVGSPKWKPDLAADTEAITEDKIFVANYDSLGKVEINYISMDTNMGTVSPDSEAIFENQNIVGSTATAKDGYKFVKWTDITGKQVSTDAKFVPTEKQSATYIAVFESGTIADKVKKLFDLEGADLAAFVGDELTNDFWKDGVKSTEKTTSPFTEEEKTAIRDALKNATVSDASERNTDHEVLSPSKGTLEIKFTDGSTLTVEQKLYVYDNGSQVPEDKDQPTPKDKVEVTYKAGDGVENFAEKTVLVKKGTKEAELPVKPVAQAKEGFKDLKWTTDPAIDETKGIQEDTTVTASAVTDHDFAKTSFTVKKVWEDDVNPVPTMNFTLYRKVTGSTEVPVEVQGAEVKTITKDNVTATWENLAKTNSEGKEYEYSAKESFKDTFDVKNENWILGEMVADANGNTITNKLKTVPGTGETPEDSKNFTGKLTITKKLENEPVALKALSMMRAPAPTASEQLKFKFKVTGPYGYVSEEFELAANESKTLENLAYGKYTVVETDAKGYTPEKANYEIILSKDAKDGAITVINKNIIPDPNKPGETNDNIIDVTVTKVWNGGEKPATEIELWRTGYGLNGKVFQEKVDIFTTTANGENTQTHKFDKLAKQDPSGKEFTYYAVEGNVPANYTASYSDDNLTVTNTYKAPAKEYTVTYKAGSSTATGTMNPVTVAENTDYTVLANGFTNDGYTFKGWKLDNGTIVQPGDTITVTEDVTLTAQWEKTTTPPTPDPDKPNPDKPNPWDPDKPNPWNPDYPNPDNPYYPERPYIPMYPEVRYETVIQEKVVEVPVPEKPYVKEVRYMQGFKGDFRPKDGLTRAEAAQILANALVEDGYKYNPNFKLSYKDIGEAWYTRAVKIVTEAKVFAGYDDGNFKPEDKITRNEWIATLKRFQEISDASGNHMNLKDGHWAMSEIEAAYNEGWLKIYSDGLATYKGDEFIPREEVAAVSNKAFNRVLDKTYIRNNEKSLISYKDVNKDMWSYEDILCASNTFLYKKDLYRAHWIKEDNNKFNVNTDGFEIVKAKFQRNPR